MSLPSGAVTFLFTDIERGITILFEWHLRILLIRLFI